MPRARKRPRSPDARPPWDSVTAVPALTRDLIQALAHILVSTLGDVPPDCFKEVLDGTATYLAARDHLAARPSPSQQKATLQALRTQVQTTADHMRQVDAATYTAVVRTTRGGVGAVWTRVEADLDLLAAMLTRTADALPVRAGGSQQTRGAGQAFALYLGQLATIYTQTTGKKPTTRGTLPHFFTL
jgi:hypothetical protein